MGNYASKGGIPAPQANDTAQKTYPCQPGTMYVWSSEMENTSTPRLVSTSGSVQQPYTATFNVSDAEGLAKYQQAHPGAQVVGYSPDVGYGRGTGWGQSWRGTTEPPSQAKRVGPQQVQQHIPSA
jgi:hypothetical protein